MQKRPPRKKKRKIRPSVSKVVTPGHDVNTVAGAALAARQGFTASVTKLGFSAAKIQ